MKLRMDEFKELARRKCHTNGFLLWRKIWGGQSAYSLVSKGIGVGYEVLKDLYNLVGEEEMVKVVDFEEETVSGFKSKYIELNGKLY